MNLTDEQRENWVALGKDRPVTWEENGLTVTRTAAWSGPGCHNGCMVLLYTDKDGKLVKVEGDSESPYNQGRLCARCLALPEVVNSQQRLMYPMKRAKEDRGKDKWERISWDQAYAEILEKFTAIRDEYGPESCIFVQGTGRDIFPYKTRLCWSFGSPNPTFLLSGSACYSPRIAAFYNTTGSFWVLDCSQNFPDRYDDPQYKVTDVLLVWGNNPIVANADGFFGHWVVDLMRRGTKLIVVDPRMTWLASKAEIWLGLRPGTDAALALGMANIIIQEKLYDEDFVDKWTYGFDAYAERCAEYPVDKVAEITWLPKEKIIAAARLFAQGDPSGLQLGLGIDQGNAEAIPGIQSISNLVAICGNLDVPGGMIAPHFVLNTGFGWGRETLADEQYEKRLGMKNFPLIRHGFQNAQCDETLNAMLKSDPYPVRATWLQTTNPLACTSADPKEVLEALLGQDIVVDIDLFMTPTAMACADYLLPATTFTERDGLRCCDGPQFGATINKTVEIGEARPDMTIDREFGHMFNPEAWPWETDEDMYTELIGHSYLNGLDFKELQQAAPVYKKVQYKNYEKGLARRDGQVGFNTRTGRIELYSLLFQEVGLDPLPYYEEGNMSPVANPDLYEKYPLILSTGARDWMSFHSEHRQIPHLRALKKWPVVQIHPKTAAQYGIEDGDWVWIENHLGRCQHKAQVTEEVQPWMVMADHGWWFPEEEGESPNNFGVWRVNVNQLIPNHKTGRAGLGSNFKGLLCKVYKVEGGE